MKERALFYYAQGYNCSLAILKAGAEHFGIVISEALENSCSAVSNGFGVGSICCALVAAIELFGILFEEERAKTLRMQLFLSFHERFGSLNCCKLSCCRQDCSEILAYVAELTERLITQMK